MRPLALFVLAACEPATTTDDASTSEPPTGDTGTTEPIVATLGGLRWELPCIKDTTAELCTTVAVASAEYRLSGTPGEVYEVLLRIRGVIEPKTYVGGVPGKGWSRGGAPAPDTANIYQLAISEPSDVYYLNAGTTRLSTELWAEAVDYTLTVPMSAGAYVTLAAESIDELQIQNRDASANPIVVPDIPPAPKPYDGQFVQMDVESIAVRPF